MEKAIGFGKEAGSDVREGCSDCWSVWVRDWGEAGSEETTLGPREGGRPLANGGAAELATCWGEGGLEAFFVLPPKPEPEVARGYEDEEV